MATELAKAYVQIIPSMKGIKSNIEKEIDGSGAAESAGTTFGSKMAFAIKAAVAAAAIGKAIKESILAGADLQQSVGGVETLFKDSASTVIQYANNAYQTAGTSANKYMEQVTSFAASLLQSLEGDTAKAAELANTAMIDMSDNANKMGTDMESITETYQSLARGNYGMLDNLKLGYGGTKSELERLMADAEKLTGEHYTVGDFADTVEAIHAIQESMGITGTTAKESATTFSGSFASMKSAATNLLATLSLGDQATMSIGEAAKALVSTAKTFLVENLIPMIGNIAKSLPELFMTLYEEIGASITAALPQMATSAQTIIDSISQGIATYLPTLAQSGFDILSNLANGILENIPTIITMAGNIVTELINGIGAAAPSILASGAQMLLNLINGIVNNLPAIITTAASVIVQLVAAFRQNLPSLLQAGIEMLGKVQAGLIQAIPTLIGKIPSIIRSIKSSFENVDWGSIGLNIIKGIANGLRNAGSYIIDAAKEAAKNALDSAKNALGIESPSKVFDAEVGQMIPRGLAQGILRKIGVVTDASEKLRGMLMTPFDGTAAKVTESGYRSVQGEQTGSGEAVLNALMTIIALLEAIVDKDNSMVLNGRKLERALREMGVVFQ